jgi:hypothetical protein
MRLSCDSNALDLIVRSATWHIEGVVVFYEESWKLIFFAWSIWMIPLPLSLLVGIGDMLCFLGICGALMIRG